jgi:cyclic beta-1,2-glucan synthetase
LSLTSQHNGGRLNLQNSQRGRRSLRALSLALTKLRVRLLSRDTSNDQIVVALDTTLHAINYTIPAIHSCLAANGSGMRRLLRLVYEYLIGSNFSFSAERFTAYIRCGLTSGVIDYLLAECALPLMQVLLVEEFSVLLLSGIKNPDISRRLDEIQTSIHDSGEFPPCEANANIFPGEGLLIADPAGVYPRMDHESKREYRIVAIKLSSSASVPLSILLSKALQLAANNTNGGANQANSHVGYYLIGSGVQDLLGALGGPAQEAIPIYSRSIWPIKRYWSIFLGFGFLVAAISFYPIAHLLHHSYITFTLLWLVACDSVSGPVERFVGRMAGERPLPILDFCQRGIPIEHRCAIVIPILLFSESQIDDAITYLEKNFLIANDSSVRAILLTDYVDAPQRDPTDTDLKLLHRCISKLDDLNKKYSSWAAQAFILMHRERRYSETQKCWMGFERKRGKLDCLNGYISNNENHFSLVTGESAEIKSIKYVAVLDDDCLLSEDSLQKMVGALAHPLNRPVLDSGRVKGGHCIVIPFSATSKHAASKWRLASMICGVQHSYGDYLAPTRNYLFEAFGRCQYPGKGVYDVNAFSSACVGRLPNDLILSHDTIEANWTRPAYCGRACVIEGLPSDFKSYSIRQHRWIRGNLQNLWFAVKSILHPDQRLHLVTWIVILNQVRIDITPFVLVVTLTFLMGETGLSNSLSVIGLIFAILIISPLQWTVLTVANDLRKCCFGDAQMHLIAYGWQSFLVGVYRLSCSLRNALIYVDAVARTIYHLCSNRRLLEWNPASLVERTNDRSFLSSYAIIASLFSFTSLICMLLEHKLTPLRVIVFSAWVIAPVLMSYMNKSGSISGKER